MSVAPRPVADTPISILSADCAPWSPVVPLYRVSVSRMTDSSRSIARSEMIRVKHAATVVVQRVADEEPGWNQNVNAHFCLKSVQNGLQCHCKPFDIGALRLRQLIHPDGELWETVPAELWLRLLATR